MGVLHDLKNEVEGSLQQARGDIKHHTGDHLGGIKDKTIGSIKTTVGRVNRKRKEYTDRNNDGMK